jgi:hypothetical protein
MLYIIKTYFLTLLFGSTIMLVPLSFETPSIVSFEILMMIPFLMIYAFIASVIPLIISLLLVNFYSSKNKLVYIIGTILTVVILNIIMSFFLDENPYSFLITLVYAIPYLISFIVIVIIRSFKINEY